MSALERTFTPEVLAELDRRMDERIEAAIAELGELTTLPTWMSVKEAADYCRVHPKSIHRLLNLNRIRSTDAFGRRRVIPREDIDQYLRSRMKEGGDAGR